MSGCSVGVVKNCARCTFLGECANIFDRGRLRKLLLSAERWLGETNDGPKLARSWQSAFHLDVSGGVVIRGFLHRALVLVAHSFPIRGKSDEGCPIRPRERRHDEVIRMADPVL